MTDSGPFEFEREGVQYTLWLATRQPSAWSSSGAMSCAGNHFVTAPDLIAAIGAAAPELRREIELKLLSQHYNTITVNHKLQDAEARIADLENLLRDMKRRRFSPAEMEEGRGLTYRVRSEEWGDLERLLASAATKKADGEQRQEELALVRGEESELVERCPTCRLPRGAPGEPSYCSNAFHLSDLERQDQRLRAAAKHLETNAFGPALRCLLAYLTVAQEQQLDPLKAVHEAAYAAEEMRSEGGSSLQRLCFQLAKRL